MDKDITIFLEHIFASIESIETYTENLSKESFLNSPQVQDAVMRKLEIIGEATKNLPDEFKNAHPEIPWRAISGMRDMLIHEYFGVDVALVWNTVQNNLPVLRNLIHKILNK